MIRGTSILTANSNRLSHFGRRMSLFLPGLVLLGILFGEQEHRLQEFHMEKILTQYVVCALAAALMVPLAQAQSQPAGLQAAFAKDAGTLSEKFTGLARVMAGKYDWRPGQGVRSVAEVFNLIVKENGLLAGVLSGTPSSSASPAPIEDPEKMQEALNLQHSPTTTCSRRSNCSEER